MELSPFCPHFHRAVEIIGRRWTGAIVRALLTGATRFSEITAAVPGLSDRLCSERLKELEAEGIVQRRCENGGAAKVEYVLTPKGEALEPAVRALKSWAHSYL